DDAAIDGLLVAFNAPVARDAFAVEIRPGSDWVRTSAFGGTVPPAGHNDVTVRFDAHDLPVGRFEGVVSVTTNDPDEGAIDVPIALVVAATTDVTASLPSRYALRAFNPVRATAVLELALPEAGVADIAIYDVRGAVVARLPRDTFAAGWHPVRWNGR